jgi:hypothetical protein
MFWCSLAPTWTATTLPFMTPHHLHEQALRLCARFITHCLQVFACPECPPSSSKSQVKLPHFIAYALHRTKLHSSVTFAVLQRLKAYDFPLPEVLRSPSFL